MDWTVTTAREHLAEVLEAAQQTPQLIYRRDQLMGAVVGPKALAELAKPTAAVQPLSASFAELRTLLAGQPSPFGELDRADRDNPFANNDLEAGDAAAL